MTRPHPVTLGQHDQALRDMEAARWTLVAMAAAVGCSAPTVHLRLRVLRGSRVRKTYGRTASRQETHDVQP